MESCILSCNVLNFFILTAAPLAFRDSIFKSKERHEFINKQLKTIPYDLCEAFLKWNTQLVKWIANKTNKKTLLLYRIGVTSGKCL